MKRSLPEEAFDRSIGIIEGPLNRLGERILKSPVVLAPLGLGWTLACRTFLAVQRGDPTCLFRSLEGEVPGTQAESERNGVQS
ncbi:MAG: hypothetical protein D6729_17690 [Deltaproteobacteria bacterium]|nr:MAG: hypothetical protein D6729_17690 [Deltaproteobacteria bacterium]